MNLSSPSFRLIPRSVPTVTLSLRKSGVDIAKHDAIKLMQQVVSRSDVLIFNMKIPLCVNELFLLKNLRDY